MKAEFFIENVKCNGCKKTIIKESEKQGKIDSIDVDIATGKVMISYTGGRETLQRFKSNLQRRGYPEKGKNNTLLTKGKSYVSCAIGRMSGDAGPKLDVGLLQTEQK